MSNIYYNNDSISYDYVDINDKPVEKTKDEYPYSYDTYVVWQNNYNKGKSNTVYSDRLYQWDYKKYNKCCREIWGNEEQYFSSRRPKDIEKFLSKYFNKEIKLTVIMQGVNACKGYPYWIFYYEEI